MAAGAALMFFGGMLQAQTQTYYTEFDFTWGVTSSNGMASISATGWDEVTIKVALTNRENLPISWYFDVVDAVDIGGGVWWCQDKSRDTDSFGQYFSWPISFNLASGISDVFTFTGTFPNNYNGIYTGCIVYYETPSNGDIETTSRKALFVSANVTASEIEYWVIARHGSSTVQKGSWSLVVYEMTWWSNTGTLFASWLVSLDNGSWKVRLILDFNKVYNIVYIPHGWLSSYLSGVVITSSTTWFDFTTWDNLNCVHSSWYNRMWNLAKVVGSENAKKDKKIDNADYWLFQAIFTDAAWADQWQNPVWQIRSKTGFTVLNPQSMYNLIVDNYVNSSDSSELFNSYGKSDCVFTNNIIYDMVEQKFIFPNEVFFN